MILTGIIYNHNPRQDGILNSSIYFSLSLFLSPTLHNRRISMLFSPPSTRSRPSLPFRVFRYVQYPSFQTPPGPSSSTSINPNPNYRLSEHYRRHRSHSHVLASHITAIRRLLLSPTSNLEVRPYESPPSVVRAPVRDDVEIRQDINPGRKCGGGDDDKATEQEWRKAEDGLKTASPLSRDADSECISRQILAPMVPP